jgi:hypothetical protein
MPVKTLKFIIIGNPENRRIGLFQQALNYWGLPSAKVLDYLDLIGDRETLADIVDSQTIIRIESPERNFLVEKAIIAAGANIEPAENHQQITAADALALEFDKGRIYYPRQWYLGWRNLLQKWTNVIFNQDNIHQSLPGNTLGYFMNHPRDIIQMFDKRICHQRFTDYSVNQPDIIHKLDIFPNSLAGYLVKLSQQVIQITHNIPPCNILLPRCLSGIISYEHLRKQMQQQNLSSVFVKLAHGSGASGVVAYRVSPKGESAITTVERVRYQGETILYNSRKIRTYFHREEIADIINILCKEGVQVEEWLPKAKLQYRPFDLRVVTIAGEAQHLVVRLGKSPMTNLHLKSDRGNSEEFLQRVGAENWQAMRQTCETAARLFPNSLYCGIDLLVYPDFRRHAILEINAFGDLLPGITWDNLDTYTSEVKAILRLTANA